MNDTASISRATSISRASKQGSTISRSQSLIKKNIAPHDLRPSDVLIERFVAWKAIVKQLVAYFEVRLFLQPFVLTPIHLIYSCQGIADIENNTAKEMTKLAAVIQVPFRSANQFLGEGGLQVRDRLLPQSLTLNSPEYTRTSTTAYGTRLVSLRINTPTWAVLLMALLYSTCKNCA